MAISKKNLKIEEIEKHLKDNLFFYICNYQKITSNKINLIRSKAKKVGFKCVVYKNNLFNIAFKRVNNTDLDIKNLVGQNIYLFRKDDGFLGLKEINNLQKQFDSNFKCMFAFFQNDLLQGEELKKLSRFNSKSDIIATFAYLLSSPMIKLALTLKSLVNLKENNKN